MEYDIPRRMLHIEVTESIMTSEEDAVLKALQSFRNAGYELWMDDFGSGYSTLNLLKDYSFDLLKLDMGFLRSDSTRSRSIIGSVIEMDKKLGIRTLAEGVETEEQVQYLKSPDVKSCRAIISGGRCRLRKLCRIVLTRESASNAQSRRYATMPSAMSIS